MYADPVTTVEMSEVSLLVAIHQPNFFPWLGFFDKVARSDVFVFFDDVQYSKTGGTWSNRVRLLIGGDSRWVTAAIDRSFSGTREILDMNFLSEIPWRQKMLRSLEVNYRRCSFYPETMGLIEPLILNKESNVARYNILVVTKIAEHLGIDSGKIARASEFNIGSVSNERLCDLTLQVGGNAYMCGAGAEGYQDELVFEQRGVKLVNQDFIHPNYSQVGGGEFISGLSIIDAAMNLGWDGVRRLLREPTS